MFIVIDMTERSYFFMQLTDVLEEFIFDCKLRRMSERTIKGYKNNNLTWIIHGVAVKVAESHIVTIF